MNQTRQQVEQVLETVSLVLFRALLSELRENKGLSIAEYALTFDQSYGLHRADLDAPAAWLEMMPSRYTGWANIGSSTMPGLSMNQHGPFFEAA